MDEGKIFWKWLKMELDRVTEGTERFVGAWETEQIIKANKMLARREEAETIYEFTDKLRSLISDKKKSGADLTNLDEL